MITATDAATYCASDGATERKKEREKEVVILESNFIHIRTVEEERKKEELSQLKRSNLIKKLLLENYYEGGSITIFLRKNNKIWVKDLEVKSYRVVLAQVLKDLVRTRGKYKYKWVERIVEEGGIWELEDLERLEIEVE